MSDIGCLTVRACDDDGRTANFTNEYGFRIYRRGDYGCIIKRK